METAGRTSPERPSVEGSRTCTTPLRGFFSLRCSQVQFIRPRGQTLFTCHRTCTPSPLSRLVPSQRCFQHPQGLPRTTFGGNTFGLQFLDSCLSALNLLAQSSKASERKTCQHPGKKNTLLDTIYRQTKKERQLRFPPVVPCAGKAAVGAVSSAATKVRQKRRHAAFFSNLVHTEMHNEYRVDTTRTPQEESFTFDPLWGKQIAGSHKTIQLRSRQYIQTRSRCAHKKQFLPIEVTNNICRGIATGTTQGQTGDHHVTSNDQQSNPEKTQDAEQHNKGQYTKQPKRRREPFMAAHDTTGRNKHTPSFIFDKIFSDAQTTLKNGHLAKFC